MTNDKAGMTIQFKNARAANRRSVSLVWVLSLVALALIWSGCATTHDHQSHLVGKIVGTSYQSALGQFTVPFPVSPESNGRIIREDAQSVTFHDNVGSTISFYSTPFTEESGMMTVLHSDGPEKALSTLAKDIYGNSIVTHFHADVRGGALSFVYLRPVKPQMGVAEFVQGNRVYLVETDLVPGVQLLSKNDDESMAALNEWLENRALELLKTMAIR